jgi:hypothetical protein
VTTADSAESALSRHAHPHRLGSLPKCGRIKASTAAQCASTPGRKPAASPAAATLDAPGALQHAPATAASSRSRAHHRQPAGLATRSKAEGARGVPARTAAEPPPGCIRSPARVSSRQQRRLAEGMTRRSLLAAAAEKTGSGEWHGSVRRQTEHAGVAPLALLLLAPPPTRCSGEWVPDPSRR